MEKTREKCQGRTKKGLQCQKSVSKDKFYCHIHDIESKKEIITKMDDICPICLEEGEEMFTLKCSHKVHLDCIKNVANIDCVLCRTPMENLPKHIMDNILVNETQYKTELENEDRIYAEQTQNSNNLFSIYIRPRPQIELKYAMLYLKSQGIPLKYLPEKIRILVPSGHPNPPNGLLFSLLVRQTLERMKQDFIQSFLNEEDYRGEEEGEEDYEGEEEEENYPFEEQDRNLRYIRRIIERISVNPQTFLPLDISIMEEGN